MEPDFDVVLQSMRETPHVHNVLQYFRYAHLPPALQERSRPFADLAARIASGPLNPEATIALRKLLEAKDAAVRAHFFLPAGA